MLNLSSENDKNIFRLNPLMREPGILIVDDDESILRSLAQVLGISFKGFQIRTAASAEEALNIIQTAPVEVLLTDLKLPSMDGLGLTRALKEQSPKTRSILMTAYGSDGIMYQATENGCLGYIQKPFKIDALINYINMALNPPPANVRAELSGLTLNDIVQLYMKNEATIVLNVTADGEIGRIVIDHGVLTQASYNNEQGPECLERMLSAKSAFVTSAQVSKPLKGKSSAEYSVEPLVITDLQDVLRTHNETHQQKNYRDFSDEELVLQPDSSLTEEGLSMKERPEEIKLRDLVNQGIIYFRSQRFDEAGNCWIKALRLDPKCAAARKNLAILEKVVNVRRVH